VHVPAAAAPPARHHEALPARAQIREQLAALVVVHHGPGRNPQHDVGTPPAVPVLAAAALAGRRAVLVPVAKVEQGRQPLVHLEDDAAAIGAVAAGRPALRNELLAPPGHGAVAAVPAPDADARLIDESSHTTPEGCDPAGPRGTSLATFLVPVLVPRR